MDFLKSHMHTLVYIFIGLSAVVSVTVGINVGVQAYSARAENRLEQKIDQQQAEFDQQLAAQQEESLTAVYVNSIASCERVNLIREVVYENTLNAVRQDNLAGFQSSLKILRRTPGIDLKTGRIDCELTVNDPRIPGPE